MFTGDFIDITDKLGRFRPLIHLIRKGCGMKTITWFLVIILCLQLTACSTTSTSPSPLPTTNKIASTETALTRIPNTEETGDYPTPTLLPYTLEKTPQAQNVEVIRDTNAQLITELSRWGLGAFKGAVTSPDRGMIALMHEQGASFISTSDWTEISTISTPFSVSEISFTMDGNAAALAGQYGDVWIVKTSNGDVLQRFFFTLTDLRSIAFTPDGNFLLVGSGDGTILQPAAGGASITTPMIENPAHNLAISADGRLLANAFDGPIEIRETSTWRVIQSIDNADWVEGMAFSTDGTLLAGFVRNRLMIWRTEGGSEWAHVDALDLDFFDPLESIDPVFALNEDWSKVVIMHRGVEEVNLRLLSLPEGKLVFEGIPENFQAPAFALFDPNSDEVITILEDNGKNLPLQIAAWNPVEKTFRQKALLNRQVTSLATSSDGQRLATGLNNGKVLILDSSSGSVIQDREILHENAVQALVFSETDQTLTSAAGGIRNIVDVWNVTGSSPSVTYDEPENFITESYEMRVCLSPNGESTVLSPSELDPSRNKDGKYYPSAWFSNLDGEMITVLKVEPPPPASGERVYYHAPYITPVTISPDGQSVVGYVNIGGPKVDGYYIWTRDGSSGRRVIGADNAANETAPLLGDFMLNAPPQTMIFSKDGQLLAAAQGSSVKIWGVETWEEVVELRSDAPEEETPTPTATVESDKYALFNSPGYEPIGMTENLINVQFSPDGSLLAGVSDQGVLRIWRVADGELLVELSDDERNTTAMISLTFSADGKFIYAGDDVGVIHTYGVMR